MGFLRPSCVHVKKVHFSHFLSLAQGSVLCLRPHQDIFTCTWHMQHPAACKPFCQPLSCSSVGQPWRGRSFFLPPWHHNWLPYGALDQLNKKWSGINKSYTIPVWNIYIHAYHKTVCDTGHIRRCTCMPVTCLCLYTIKKRYILEVGLAYGPHALFVGGVYAPPHQWGVRPTAT